jgi:WD40 repeat protein
MLYSLLQYPCGSYLSVTPMSIPTPIHHQHDTTRLAVASDNVLLAIATIMGDVSIHHLLDGTLIRQLERHPAGIWGIAFSPDSTRLAICSSASDSPDGTVELWHVPSWTRMRLLSDPETGGGHSLAFSSDSQQLLVGHVDGQTRLWQIADATVRHTFEATSEIPLVATSQLRPIAAIANDGVIRLWQVADMCLLQTFKTQTDWPSAIALAPNAHYLAASNMWGVCEVWRTTGELLCQLPAAPASRIAFSPDGQMLACGGDDGQISVYRIPDGTLIMTISAFEKWLRDLQFTADGGMLIASGQNGAVRFWQVARM